MLTGSRGQVVQRLKRLGGRVVAWFSGAGSRALRTARTEGARAFSAPSASIASGLANAT